MDVTVLAERQGNFCLSLVDDIAICQRPANGMTVGWRVCRKDAGGRMDLLLAQSIAFSCCRTALSRCVLLRWRKRLYFKCRHSCQYSLRDAGVPRRIALTTACAHYRPGASLTWKNAASACRQTLTYLSSRVI